MLASEAKLSQAEVIRLANAAAQKDGRDLTKYEAPEPHYEYLRKDDTWVIFYMRKIPAPGSDFSVRIQDKTKKVEVVPGM